MQKLDYLQLLIVEAVSEAVGRAWDGIMATGARIKRAGADAGAAAAAEAARVAEETGVQYAPHVSLFSAARVTQLRTLCSEESSRDVG